MSDLRLDVGLAAKLKVAFARNGWTEQLIDEVCEGDKLGQFRKVLLGQASITLSKLQMLSTTVSVDRSERPVYPDWVKAVMHPELENTGPAQYDLAAVELWVPDGIRGDWLTSGNRLYERLKSADALKSCLGLADAEAIQKMGIEVFRAFFAGKHVYFWRSVVRRRYGRLHVPVLYEFDENVVLDWEWLNGAWYENQPAARLAG